jgi:hypothetical protein
MPYLTHPVRRLRDDPVEGEPVTLLVRAADETDREELADRLATLGTVEARHRFGTVEATVPQSAVDAVCDLSGIASIETTNTHALDADGAGEDVTFEE